MAKVSNALLVTRDLFFSSQIEGIARSAGTTLKIAPRLPDAQVLEGLDLIIIDLELPELDFPLLSRLLESHEMQSVGYGSHVKSQLFAAGSDAGLEQLVARGRVHECLQNLFRAS